MKNQRPKISQLFENLFIFKLLKVIENRNVLKIHFFQFIKPKKLDYEPRYKMKGKSKGRKKEQRKKGVQEEHKRETIKEIMDLKEKEKEKHDRPVQSANVLDRFKKRE